MVPLTALWLPILLSGVAVFVTSSIIHMALPYHRSDYARVPNEETVMDALRRFDIPPGDYFMPRAADGAEMKTPEYKEKVKKGPVALLTIMRPGAFAMGPRLGQWFLYTLVVSAFAGLLAGHAVGPLASHRRVFHYAALPAWGGYALALLQNSIWYARKWSTTLKSTFDGLIYAVITGLIFAWLWP